MKRLSRICYASSDPCNLKVVKEKERNLKLNEKVSIVFSPVERKITFESCVFKYERININVDDYRLCIEHGLKVPDMVDEDGSYFDHVPLFAGLIVLTDDGKEGNANGGVIKELISCGHLLAKGSLRHYAQTR